MSWLHLFWLFGNKFYGLNIYVQYFFPIERFHFCLLLICFSIVGIIHKITCYAFIVYGVSFCVLVVKPPYLSSRTMCGYRWGHNVDTNCSFSISLHLFALPPSHACKHLPKLKNYSISISFILLLFSQHIGYKLYLSLWFLLSYKAWSIKFGIYLMNLNIILAS